MLPNPWIILAVVLVWIGSLVAVGSWQRTDGETKAKAVALAEKNVALAAANKEIERFRAIERDSALRIAAIGDDHAQKVSALESQHLRDVDAVRAGALKLRIPNACPANRMPGPSTPASGSDGATACELPQPLANALLGAAADADRNTLQLSACQAVVNSYLKEKP